MILAEKYAIADLNAVMSYERHEGRAEGQAKLMAAIKDARTGISYDDLVVKYGKDTAKNAMIMK